MADVTNAFVATPPIDGGVYFNAPLGTTLPTDATTALAAGFKDNGAVGPDGFTVNPTRSVEKEKQFGGGTWIVVQTDYEETVVLTLLEDDNEDVLKTVFGDANVIVEPATASAGTTKKIFHTATPMPIKSHVVNAVSGTKKKRLVIERGQVTEVAEVQNVHSASTKYQITIDCLASSVANNNYATVAEFRDDGKVATPSEWDVAITGSPTGGTYQLTVTRDGSTQTTSALPFNATTAAVDAALEALPNVGAGNASVTGTAAAYTVSLALGGVLGKGTIALTGGTSPNVTITAS